MNNQQTTMMNGQTIVDKLYVHYWINKWLISKPIALLPPSFLIPPSSLIPSSSHCHAKQL
ncbi:hypothetical protein ACKFKF_08420 [Phormidesmis sp. 146-12]